LAEVEKYKQTFEQKQIALGKKIKKFNLRGCQDEWGLEIPAEAYTALEVRVNIVITPG
jgi:hypothetical protein